VVVPWIGLTPSLSLEPAMAIAATVRPWGTAMAPNQRNQRCGRQTNSLASDAVRGGMAKIQPRTESRDDDMTNFTAAYIRRALEPRLQGHGHIDVRKSALCGYTIVHRYTSEWNGREVALPVARLRAKGQQLHLYWKHANGRWVPYENGDEAPFVGSLDTCLKEIDRDRRGCFWG
jgi:hypothetical protein